MLKERLFTYPGSGSTWAVCENLKIKRIMIFGLMGQKFNLYTNDELYGTVEIDWSNQYSLDLTNTVQKIVAITGENFQQMQGVSNATICSIRIWYEEG